MKRRNAKFSCCLRYDDDMGFLTPLALRLAISRCVHEYGEMMLLVQEKITSHAVEVAGGY